MEPLIGTAKGLQSGLFGLKGISEEMVPMGTSWKQLLPETRAYLSQLTIYPDYFWVKALDILIRTLIADNNWVYLDRMFILATEIRQHATISIINPNGINATWPTTATEVSTPTWKALKGYTFDGSSSYLNLQYNPSTQGVNYKGTNTSLGFYRLTNTDNGHACDIGASDGTNITQWYSNLAGNDYAILNATAGQNNPLPKPNGLFHSARSANTLKMYNAGVNYGGSLTETGSTIPNFNLTLATRNQTVISQFAGRQYGMVFAGGNSINALTFYNAFQTFATTIGFNV